MSFRSKLAKALFGSFACTCGIIRDDDCPVHDDEWKEMQRKRQADERRIARESAAKQITITIKLP